MAINCGIASHRIEHAITSNISHHGVLYPLQDLENQDEIKLSYVDLDNNGIVSQSNLEDKVFF